MGVKAALVGVVVVVGVVAFFEVSNWWERAYAKYESSELSPDGCIRIDTYEPFWVLPSVFHRIPRPEGTHYGLGRVWNAAVFKRAYEVRTGDLLGETVVFDPVGPASFVDWGDTAKPGRRVVVANQFPIVDSMRCADEATLAKLEAYHVRRREENRPIQEAWEEARRRAFAPKDARR
ncbi:MAG TPA: hypothetical protein VM621_15420 [Luteibacter sp.]|nr:hypothetical protein [Luteibacter sp.]